MDPDRVGVWGTSFSGGLVLTVAALDRFRAAMIAAGALVDDVAAPEEHNGLVAVQETIMSYEMARSLADERIRHSEEISPRLARAA